MIRTKLRIFSLEREVGINVPVKHILRIVGSVAQCSVKAAPVPHGEEIVQPPISTGAPDCLWVITGVIVLGLNLNPGPLAEVADSGRDMAGLVLEFGKCPGLEPSVVVVVPVVTSGH